MITPFIYLDLHQRQRQRSLQVLQIILLAILALFVLGTFATPLLADRIPFANPSALSDGLCSSVLVLQGVVMLLLAPFGAADRLSRESEQRTLPALLNSPASPASIFFGKLAGAFVFDLFLWSLFLPALALTAFFTTHTAGYMIGLALANLATGFYLSLVALAASARSKRALHAFLRLGVAYLVWYVFFPFLLSLLSIPCVAADVAGFEWLLIPCFAHNPVAFQMLLLGAGKSASPAWTVAYLLSTILLWLLLSLHLVRRSLRSLRTL